jgi:PAS domain S-box-containing protein
MLAFPKWPARNGTSGHNVAKLKADVVDKVSSAIMMVDRDLVVTYVNDSTRELLKKNETAFRAMWPNFDADNIVGVCIDSFHKDPAHQRKLLADPAKFPIRTEITIGDLKIALVVNGVFDPQGKHVGNVLEWRDVTGDRLNAGKLEALNKAQAVIEFTVDGKILDANDNFLKTMGYALEEIRGQHHSIFVEPDHRNSQEYRAFWEKLGRGEFDSKAYKRIAKGGREVWIQASYSPIVDANGKVFRVVKYATDITASVHANQAIQFAVKQTQDVVKAAEANDLTRRIPMEGKSGEVAALCSGVNGLLDTMATVVRKIKGAALEVSNASAEISASTTDLSQRTEEQAASLEQTSASMEQIAATVKKNAENAQEANRSAIGTREVADRGGQVVAKAVEAMARIEESSGKISDIIGVIDEIARQTNLLALNAAVEAARAGDAGRGFAVVASEVRSLAQRSSQAAKDIKDLITNSNGQVKDGVELVNRAGTALNEIVDSIKKVTNIVSDIANASTEQATGIEQINKALTQMDEATQQNSALVEENAATAKTLEQQAGTMSAEVNAFRLDEGTEARAQTGERSRAAPKAAEPEPAKLPAGKGPAAKTPAEKETAAKAPAPKIPVSRPRMPARGASVGQMQTALATAYQDPEWKDF